MKKNIVGILLVASIFMVGCNTSQNNNQSSAKVADEHGHEANEEGHADEIAFTAKQAAEAGMKIETARAAQFLNVIKTSGVIQTLPGDEQAIVATSAGIVSFVNASIAAGVPVRSGEAIVTISARNLQEGDPSLKAKIAFEVAQKEYQRAKGLVETKIISDKEFEQARLRYETAKAAYQGQASNVTAAGIRVTSPMGGYIKNLLVGQGEYVSVGQPIATVTQNRRLQLRAEVSETYFGDLKNIRSANFKTAYESTTYKLSEMNGRLLSYGKTSNGTSFYIPVTFEFDNIGNVIPGSFTEVYLLSAPRGNVISVPVSALTEEQGLNFVYIQIEPEAYIKREVVVGQNNGERAEIVKGLTGGEAVVVKGVTQVKLASASGAIPDGHNH